MASKAPSDAAMEKFFNHAILKKGAIEVVLVSLSDGVELDVFSWELPQDIGEFDLRSTLDDVYAYAENDVEGYGDLKSFVLVGVDEDQERVARSPTFTIEPQDAEEEAEEGSAGDRDRDGNDRGADRGSGGMSGEGPGALARSLGRGGAQSEAAQVIGTLERTNLALMRHLETQHRLNTSGSQVTQSALEKIIGRLGTMNEAMMSTQVETLTAIQAMYDRSSERDLRVAREKKGEERKDQIMGQLMQFLPLLGMKLLPGFVPPGVQDPRIAALNEFFASVDVSKMMEALTNAGLTPEQLAGLQMVLQTFADQAAAEEAKQNGGAAPAPSVAAVEEAPPANGRH